MTLFNCYQDAKRAEAYAKLEFKNTYHLAFRDLPRIINDHALQGRALDFGCGTGRSTRFLKSLGFRSLGVDIALEMIKIARQIDNDREYRLVAEGEIGSFPAESFDLVLSAFTFDNIPERTTKARLLHKLGRLLTKKGRFINIVSSPDLYVHDWASFTTRDFPENKQARSGDVVRCITTDFEDRRPCLDILFTDESYREAYQEAGLEVVEMHKPLADGTEPYSWVNETRIAPWVIYVLKNKHDQ